ncbi:hypothetical protein ACE1OC_15280 [Streptomyces sp. DSM 116496]|uniref:hypothetical protein n=1 Tax=Streptomyces stoeckheimensis TaxID=3344656 RepID=UPI0038B33456
MSMRQKAKVRGGAAVAVAAVLALALAGCGGGGEKAKEPTKSETPQSQGSSPQQPAPTASKGSGPLEVIATAQGPSGVVLELNSAVRDQDGYVTVSGQIKNTGSATFSNIGPLRGDEKTASPASVAGASLVDSVGKKRYLVLRDTEGRCACTTGLAFIKSGESAGFFAQFPAPPATTTEVVFGLPTFAAATIKISG